MMIPLVMMMSGGGALRERADAKTLLQDNGVSFPGEHLPITLHPPAHSLFTTH